MTSAGPLAALLGLAALAAAGLALALVVWPPGDPEILEHRHDDLPVDHPHLREGPTHAHPYVIDENHPRWPVA